MSSNAEAARLAPRRIRRRRDRRRDRGAALPVCSRSPSTSRTIRTTARASSCIGHAGLGAARPRQDVADPVGAEQGRRGLPHARAAREARRVDDALRVAPGALGHLGVLLLRRHRGPRARSERRRRARRTARVCARSSSAGLVSAPNDAAERGKGDMADRSPSSRRSRPRLRARDRAVPGRQADRGTGARVRPRPAHDRQARLQREPARHAGNRRRRRWRRRSPTSAAIRTPTASS